LRGDFLDNLFGAAFVPGEPSRETIGFDHVRQKDFIERYKRRRKRGEILSSGRKSESSHGTNPI